MRATAHILANNAFYYYQDLVGATRFYTDVLGFPLVADYGFARIVQAAPASFLTLVDVNQGMHDAHEAKAVTTAFVTDELEAWYVYLTAQGVPMHRTFDPKPDSAHDGFVALDPAGYFLEFERFNVHAENMQLMPILNALPSRYPGRGHTCPTALGVKATVTWLYYNDMPRAQRWLEDVLGLSLLVDQGFATVYQSSPSGFIGPVRAGDGLHAYAAEKLVTVSLITDDVEAWFARLSARDDVRLRHDEITLEGSHVELFVAYDPEGYFWEFDRFRETAVNQEMQRLLGTAKQVGA
ncbi:MAG: VOC family protein [Caldilineaceae bacterium]|nr:VOC family protein [Caldilineaceae bacterium]